MPRGARRSRTSYRSSFASELARRLGEVAALQEKRGRGERCLEAGQVSAHPVCAHPHLHLGLRLQALEEESDSFSKHSTGGNKTSLETWRT